MIVEAFQGEASRLWMEGVQFRHMGQVFRQRCSALTVAGNAQMAGEMAALEVGWNDLKCPIFSTQSWGRYPQKPSKPSSQLTNWIRKCQKTSPVA